MRVEQGQVEYRPVEYDCERVVRVLRGSVKTGRNAGWYFVLHAQEIARGRGEDTSAGFSEETASLAEATFAWGEYGV